MSEWASFIAVFWLLWAADGLRIARRRSFTVVGWRRARAWFARLSLPGALPVSWRVTAEDVPVSMAPQGLCNRGTGEAGRPGEAPPVARAWAWDEVREAVVADGWLMINGVRFCPDTGHLGAAELLAIARAAPAAREARVRQMMRRWLLPAHLRRRRRVLIGRTRAVVVMNGASLAGLSALSVYVVADAAAQVPERVGGMVVTALPWVLLALAGLHFSAVIAAWRATRRLRPVGPEKRGLNLFTALLMPPQALKLRALVGEGFFPAQHPLAVLLAFETGAARREAAFHTLADLRWPVGGAGDPPLAREIVAWYRGALRAEIESRLRAAGLDPEELLAAPKADGPASCAYCPRCGDQFVAGRRVCPQGVELQALAPR
ncbi:MAG: hypothetical protein Q8N18_08665 [Opitutaceae bacterium]|nr:hypothetical protein [Opitutaceae bacterium]